MLSGIRQSSSWLVEFMNFQDLELRADSRSADTSTSCQDPMLASQTDDQTMHNGTALADTRNSATDSIGIASENSEAANQMHFDGLAVQASQHLNGRCQACVFLQSQLGCPRGEQCPYCHQDHPVLCRRIGLRRGPRERISRRVLRAFRGQNLSEVHEPRMSTDSFLLI